MAQVTIEGIRLIACDFCGNVNKHQDNGLKFVIKKYIISVYIGTEEDCVKDNICLECFKKLMEEDNNHACDHCRD